MENDHLVTSVYKHKYNSNFVTLNLTIYLETVTAQDRGETLNDGYRNRRSLQCKRENPNI